MTTPSDDGLESLSAALDEHFKANDPVLVGVVQAGVLKLPPDSVLSIQTRGAAKRHRVRGGVSEEGLAAGMRAGYLDETGDLTDDGLRYLRHVVRR